MSVYTKIQSTLQNKSQCNTCKLVRKALHLGKRIYIDISPTLLEKRVVCCPTGGTFKGSLNGSKLVFRTILEPF